MGAKKRALERQEAMRKRYLMVGGTIAAIAVIIGAVVAFAPTGPQPPNAGPGDAYAVIQTASGTIVFKFREDMAPTTCANFIGLVQGGYYNGLQWHRVEPKFVIQTGSPELSGRSADPRPTIPLELSALKNDYGTVGVARTNDPNSGSTQFYINTGQNNNLDPPASNPGYAVFGVVTRGMDVALKVTKGETIQSITFVRQPTPP